MNLKEWAYLGNYDFFTTRLSRLSIDQLLPEKWSFASKNDFGILKNYLHNTFTKLYCERQGAPESEKQNFIYMDDSVACFNTGLFDKTWQTIFFYCEKNPNTEYQDWIFKGFHTDFTIKYTTIPADNASSLRRASYFDNPEQLILNPKLRIVPQWEHILHDPENFARIPSELQQYGPHFCQSLMDGSIAKTQKRIEANYKTVVPQYYKGKIQLLIPLFLTNEENPELALVLSLGDNSDVYYGHTCLTTEMAYNNARLIARPDSYWLQP